MIEFTNWKELLVFIDNNKDYTLTLSRKGNRQYIGKNKFFVTKDGCICIEFDTFSGLIGKDEVYTYYALNLDSLKEITIVC